MTIRQDIFHVFLNKKKSNDQKKPELINVRCKLLDFAHAYANLFLASEYALNK